MKRCICFILVLLCLTGCHAGNDRLKEPVTFYYLRDHADKDEQELFFSEGAIGSEEREASGHLQDLNYLLSLYLKGPNDRKLDAVFPIGSKVLDIQVQDMTLTVRLNAISANLGDMELTVACACLAKTCIGITEAESVTVVSYDPDGKELYSRVFTNELLILDDGYPADAQPSGDSK